MIRNGILFFLFWIFSVVTYADNKNYQIELLVFSHITPASLSSEFWPMSAGVYDDSQHDASFFRPVDPKHFLLHTEAVRLARQNNYHVLYHAAWIASASDLTKSKTIYIESNTKPSELNGLLRIALHHYFNIHLKFVFSEPTQTLRAMASNPSFHNAPDTFYFILDQKRRMRSRELNYIGHPLFGALVKIIPTKIHTKSIQS